MPKASKGESHRELGAGWAALRDGHWEVARARFQQVADSSGEPEAFEGLSWAAWWLDEADAVFAARERAYRLYAEAQDASSAARMATWLASDQLDFNGAHAVASGWLGRARRLLDPLEPGAEHGWLAFIEGYLAGMSGDSAKAVELGARSAELGRRFGVPDLEMLGLALEGASLVADAEVDAGMRCLDEATATAVSGEAEIPISGAWTCCFLVTACTTVRDYRRALEWCRRIEDFAERYGSRYMLAFCRAGYGALHLWHGEWDRAEAILAASIEDFRRSRPAMVDGALLGLAELRRRQGRSDEAAALLDQVGPSSAERLCRAHMALDRGEAELAADFAGRALRQVPTDRVLDRAPALELRARALVAIGKLEEAGSALESLRRIAAAAGTEPLRASVDFTAGLLAAAGGDYESARPLLEDAVDGYERSGGPFEGAQARIELAATLAALDHAEAEAEAGRAVEQLDALGAGGEVRRARLLLERTPGGGDSEPPLAELTPREREVLALISEGLTNREIAGRLVVSEHTIHRHVTNMLRKLDLPSRTAAAALAVREGLPSGHPE